MRRIALMSWLVLLTATIGGGVWAAERIAAKPCTAREVLLVSGPVKVLGSAGGQGVAVSDRYDSHSPLEHCCFSSHAIPFATAVFETETPAEFSAARARPCRNAPSNVGSCDPNRPASTPVLRDVADSLATRLFGAPVPPKCRGSTPAAWAARMKSANMPGSSLPPEEIAPSCVCRKLIAIVDAALPTPAA